MRNDKMELVRSLRHPDADRVDEVFPPLLLEELLRAILPATDDRATAARGLVADPAENPVRPETGRPLQARRLATHRRRALGAAAAAVAAVLGLLAGVGVIGGGKGLSRPITTAWRRARLFGDTGSRGETTRRGTWRLVDALLTGTWQQNDYGPPPGWFSCSPDDTCYVLAGRYASAMAGAALLSESLYVSNDEGATWSAISLPSGLVPTTPLECSGPQWCATGATYDGQPVLAVTIDGGHSFTLDPLATGVGTLRALSCPATHVCEGLAANSDLGTTPVGSTLLVTDDGGRTFRDEQIVAGDSMVALACSSPTDCTVVGATDASMGSILTAGVSAVTSDQGRTWTEGSFPVGFGIDSDHTSVSCPDAQHCFVTGYLPMRVQDPPRCTALNRPKAQGATLALPEMSPEAEAISKRASEILEAEAERQTTPNLSTCPDYTMTDVTDVASTNDGGVAWKLDLLPTDVPRPHLEHLSCPTDTVCWVAGTEFEPQRVGNRVDAGSPVLVGTTDGGSTWSKVVFSVPSTAPDATGRSSLSIGSVTCPTASVCLARGTAARGSRYAPVYRLEVPVS